MPGIRLISRFTSLLMLVSVVQSCGLKYVPGPSLEDLEQNRKTQLEERLGKDFAAVNKKYTPLTYGETVVVKPQSYQRLDSLFEVKYRLSKQGMSSKEVDPLIEQQKMTLLADTTEVLYMETHWFELAQDSTYEFIVAQCFLNNRNVLRKMDFIDEFQTGKSDRTWAEQYMKEDPLTRFDLGYTSNEDLALYSMFKNKEFTLQGEEKDRFLKNIFQVMRIANENRSTAPQGIVIKLASQQMKREIPNFQSTDYAFSYKKEVNPDTKESIYVVEATSDKDKSVVVTRRYNLLFMPLD